MTLRIFLFLLGFGLTVTSLSYIILYLNLLSLGYNFLDYVNFIIKRVECLNVFLGILLMFLTLNINGGKDELYL